MKKTQLWRIISLIVCAVFLAQCGVVEVLDYTHQSDQKQEFYDFGDSLPTQANRVLFIGDSHVANDEMSELFRQKLHAGSRLNNFITPKYQRNQALQIKHSGFDKTPLNDKRLGINLLTYKSTHGASASFSGEIIRPSFLVRFDRHDTKFIIKQNHKQIAFNASRVGKWQEIKTDIIGGFELLADDGIYFANIINNTQKYVDNLGVNGAALSWWHYIDGELMQLQTAQAVYDVAIVSFGTNDSINPYTDINAFKSRLERLIGTLKNMHATIILLNPHLSVYRDKDTYKKAPLHSQIRQAIMQTAKKQRVAVYDMQAFMDNLGGKAQMIKDGYSQQDTHLTLLGYNKIAQNLFAKIKGAK